MIPNPGNSGDWNRYAYVNYNPANFSDPTGHSSFGDDYDPADEDAWAYYGNNAAIQWADNLGLSFENQSFHDNLPDYIPTDDPDLFSAYIYLYNSTTSFIVNPYTGETSSGHEMALWIAENGLEISWDWLLEAAYH